MKIENTLRELRKLFESEIQKVCEKIEEPEFELMDSLSESASNICTCGFLMEAIQDYQREQEQEIDSLGEGATPVTMEDFLRAVNSNDLEASSICLNHILGVPPEAAEACARHFMMKWKSDPECYSRVKEFVACQNMNQYQWLLHELFGITGISNSE